jgi:hypothetical protein
MLSNLHVTILESRLIGEEDTWICTKRGQLTHHHSGIQSSQ